MRTARFLPMMALLYGCQPTSNSASADDRDKLHPAATLVTQLDNAGNVVEEAGVTKTAANVAPSPRKNVKLAPQPSSPPAPVDRSAPPLPANPPPYVALGTEPFWSVSIFHDHVILSQPGEVTRNFAVTAMQKGNIRRFSGDGLTITIVPGSCSDGMSDRQYRDRVQIAIGMAIMKGCGQPEPGQPPQ